MPVDPPLESQIASARMRVPDNQVHEQENQPETDRNITLNQEKEPTAATERAHGGSIPGQIILCGLKERLLGIWVSALRKGKEVEK